MKNAIRYYYNLYVENIHQADQQYRFQIEQDHYLFIVVDLSLEEVMEVYQLSTQLLQHGVLCHEIILNQQNQVVTIINQKPYVLLKMRFYKNDLVILNDCFYLTQYGIEANKSDLLKRNDWYQLWTLKIDYLEYQVSQFGKKFPIVRESFGYFIGLSENSITLFQQLSKKNAPLCVAHRRVYKNQTLSDFYNPLNFVIDFRIRDISEYFKMRFFEGIPILEEIESYLKKANLSEDELQLFFCRMMFPTYYFDLYEKIIAGEVPEKALLDIVDHVLEYEEFLRALYLVILKRTLLPEIEWIKKKM